MKYLEGLFITDVHQIIEVSYEKKTSAFVKDREAYGICFAKRGSVTYRHRGKNYVCDETHAVIMPMGATYSWDCTPNSTFLIINFLSTNTFVLHGFIEILLKNPSAYFNNFPFLEKSFSMRNITGNAEYLSVLYKIINALNRENDNQIYPQIGSIIEFINDNFSNREIDNSLLAKQVNMSVSHFRSSFKKSYNTSPMSYIQNLRIEKAKHLLLYSCFSVSEISEKCGFSNLYSFSRAFKTSVGVSPSEFAKQNKTYII